ncbi:PDZ and LIM domain protein 1-like isoform X1 [Mytilus californianus]|uniref:PDZ and LIM domain protein 1-like isoform X1 n=1 Tax=Mytilus californianus TaxID=6549 RepID=UPI002246F697|nr:PDZ and LIM domain protein 1-like isoform X1 [Mytilus californianus]
MSNVEYRPAETLTIRLSRRDSGVSWGFRLQGGTDFNIPLSVQSVNPNSVADRAGLQAGDGILFINNANTDQLSHEQAKMEMIRSGNEIYMTVVRGAVEVWKPKVTALSDLRPQELRQIKTATGDTVTAVQKTDLTRDGPLESLKIGSSHNRSAKPFGQSSQYEPPRPEYQQQQYRPPPQQQHYQPPPQQQQQYRQQQQQQQQQYRPPPQQQRQPMSPTSPKAPVPTVVHAQFNSPIGLYSAPHIAESYDVQTKGIQKEMENLDVEDAPVGMKISGTYQPLPEDTGDDDDDDTEFTEHAPLPETADDNSNSVKCEDNNQHEIINTNPDLERPSGFRSVTAPKFDPSQNQSPKQESMHCVKCGNMVSGVFVKIKGQPYHAQCFTCTSCGVNLKQKGYFVIEGCLFCEIHAKQRAEAPGPNMRQADVIYR